MSRRELARHERFEQISPEVGTIDDDALDAALAEDPDATLALLAEMSSATDTELARRARQLAGSLFLDVARRGPQSGRGIGRIRVGPYEPDRGDLDLDASIDALTGGRTADVEQLRVRAWDRPGTAWCLVVDRSGSMGGMPLATSALAAAAVALRAPTEHAVLAFANDVQAVKPLAASASPETVVNAVLGLRGSGTTDLARALCAAGAELAASRAARRITVLLSDCRANVPGDPIAAAASLDELLVIAPHADSDEAEAFAAQVGARCVTITGPSDIPAAFAAITWPGQPAS